MKFYIALFCLASCITLNAAQVAKTLSEEQEEAQRCLTAKMSYYVACNFIGHLKKLEALLQQNTDVLNTGPVTVIDDGAMPLLHYAIKKRNLSAVALFIKYGANINADINAEFRRFATPLIYASVLNRKKIIQLLIENQANLELYTPNGMTALMTAAFFNNYAVVSMLIAAGANKNAQNVHDHHKTAFDYAAALSTIYNQEQFQKKYLAAVEAGEAERNRYLAAQKIARKKIQNYIPIKDLAKIVASYAYGQSPTDLPEQKGKNNCAIQ